MSPERLQQIEELYHSACEHREEDREAFLLEACGDDADLLRRVSALLAQDTASGLMAELLRQVAASLMGESLKPGATLGPYRIDRRLGKGGMGEVYAARDTRLGRDVAIKTSKKEFSGRFQREARAIAALNHPHICTLYDVGPDYLVMERIEGAPVRGPLPQGEATRIAIQIAAAVRHAHLHGVIHRDLKPDNILLARSGVKVLDFGLAKLDPSNGTAEEEVSTTLTGQAQIVGTLRYMAPEQLKGQPADARSDIFSFGAILYELLTGGPPFPGDSQADVIASVLRGEPEALGRVKPGIAPAMEHLVRNCLAKDTDERYQSMQDVLLQLEWIAGGASQQPEPMGSARSRREWLAWGAAAVMAGALGFAMISPRPKPAVRVSARFDQPFQWYEWINGETPSVSPDGRSIAFTTQSPGEGYSGRYSIWVRRLDRPNPEPLPGTDFGDDPFWAPNSGTVAYRGSEEVRTIAIGGGGEPQRLCNIPPNFAGGAWGRNGVILLGSYAGPMYRVSASGGVAQPFLPLDTAHGEKAQAWPHFLPDGRHFLYTSLDKNEKGGVYAGSLDSTQVHRVLDSPGSVNWVEPGLLLFPRGRSLMAQPFDTGSMRLQGEPYLVADQVMRLNRGKMVFDSSPNGTLVYWPERSTMLNLQPTWRDRNGIVLGTVGQPAMYRQATLSPDEKWLAAQVLAPPPDRVNDVWLMNLVTGIMTRFAADGKNKNAPIWSPDGREVLYGSVKKGPMGLYRKPVGGGEERLVYAPKNESVFPCQWLRDGSLLFLNINGESFFRMPVDGASPETLLKTAYGKDEPRVSPDGRWVAYNTFESGRWEVYIASFPGFTERRQVSNAGGVQGYWRKDGHELFFLSLDGDMMSVALGPGNPPEPAAPKRLFRSRVPVSALTDQFAATGNGEKFILLENTQDISSFLTVVVNWPGAGQK